MVHVEGGDFSWHELDGMCYGLQTNYNRTFEKANASCLGYSYELVSVDNLRQHAFLLGVMNIYMDYWVGLTFDASINSTFLIKIKIKCYNQCPFKQDNKLIIHTKCSSVKYNNIFHTLMFPKVTQWLQLDTFTVEKMLLSIHTHCLHLRSSNIGELVVLQENVQNWDALFNWP